MKTDTSLRNILMLKMIPREPHFTTAERLRERLADQGYDLNLRTIQRDLNKYSLKFEIRDFKVENSKAKCWCWSKDASVWDMPDMTPMIALTFNLVESFLIRIIPKSILQFMDPHFKRATHLLGSLRKSKWAHWNNKISIIPRGIELIPPEIDHELFETIFEAVLEEKQIQISYTKREASDSIDYQLNPLGLVFNQELIYLVAIKDGKTYPQHFALHRMNSASSTDSNSHIPESFNLQKYCKEGAFQYLAGGELIQLKALFDPKIAKHLYETRLTEKQKLTEQTDGRILLEAHTKNSSALKWWLLAFGAGVEVIKPDELREEFASIAINLESVYKRPVKNKIKTI